MKDLNIIEVKIREYEKKIEILKKLEKEFNILDLEGFEKEAETIRKKLKDPKKVDEVKKDIATLKDMIKRKNNIVSEIEKLNSKINLIYGLDRLLKNVKKELKRKKYDCALQYITKCKKLMEEAKPKLRIKLLNTWFTLNFWNKAKMEIINEGDAIAKNIIFTFSDDIIVRSLPKIEVKPKSRKVVEFYLRPNMPGEVPVEIEIKCIDHLNREYRFTEVITIKVRKEVKEKEGISPGEFTPKPTTPKTFPPELANRYTEVEYIGKGGFARVFKANVKTGKKLQLRYPCI